MLLRLWLTSGNTCCDKAHADKILGAGAAMLTLGGDHFISYPLLQAHAEKHGSLSMIHFDAHHDTESDGDEKRIDHGSMFFTR